MNHEDDRYDPREKYEPFYDRPSDDDDDELAECEHLSVRVFHDGKVCIDCAAILDREVLS